MYPKKKKYWYKIQQRYASCSTIVWCTLKEYMRLYLDWSDFIMCLWSNLIIGPRFYWYVIFFFVIFFLLLEAQMRTLNRWIDPWFIWIWIENIGEILKSCLFSSDFFFFFAYKGIYSVPYYIFLYCIVLCYTVLHYTIRMSSENGI